jgi:DNA transposition AAA+ family ATPase
MTEKYIKVSSITEKLRKAEESGRTLYIGGVSGVGKTAAVKNYPVLFMKIVTGALAP